MAVKEQYQVKISRRFAALGNLDSGAGDGDDMMMTTMRTSVGLGNVLQYTSKSFGHGECSLF
jgi:hypothetical protein